MEVKLDNSILDIINSNYQIDPSVFREIEQRRQNSEAATRSIKDILQNAPTKPPLHEASESVPTQFINNYNYKITLNENQLDSILELLSLLDVSIDKVDNLIIEKDLTAMLLIDELNSGISSVKISYDERIQNGCRSSLIWKPLGTSTSYDAITGAATTFSNFEVIDDPSQQVILNNYGIKYYQKPLNRDYGFNIISEFKGTISVGSNSLVVISPNGITGMAIGDEVTDNLISPVAFNIGSLPRVISFGTTSLLGITTSISGNVALGSSVIAYTGVGLTGNISIGEYVVNIDLFDSDTQVVGFGTTITTITYNDVELSTFITKNLIVPSIILSKVSFGSMTNARLGFGTYSTYPSISLSNLSNITAEGSTFTVIRQTEDITQNFNYTDSPIDPVVIGCMNNNKVGVGHTIKFINNGKPLGPSIWREVLDEPEPDIGAGFLSYYSGTTNWPYDLLYGYAVKGVIYSFSEGYFPFYTNISPEGIGYTDGVVCDASDLNITEKENTLAMLEIATIPKIVGIVTISNILRKARDKDELQAWAYLQSASYLRSQNNELNLDIVSLGTIN